MKTSDVVGFLFFVICSIAKNDKKPVWAIFHIKCYEKNPNIEKRVNTYDDVFLRMNHNCYHWLLKVSLCM